MSERLINEGRRLELRKHIRELSMELEDCRRLIRELLPPGGDVLNVDGLRLTNLASRFYGIQLKLYGNPDKLEQGLLPQLAALNEELGE